MHSSIIDFKYKVIRELGLGGSSTVFFVEDADGKQLALKLLNRKIGDRKIVRLKNEFRLMRSLRHPNIAQVYDFGLDQASGCYYFTLEYLSEGNFYDFNNRHKKDEILLKSFYQLLCGLSYLHNSNFIHYDITPNNVLVTKDENGEFVVKITDFGLTEQFEPADTHFAGTLNFMSPEMIQGRKGLDQRTDIFSAGLVLLYYLIDSDRYLPTSTVLEFIRKRLAYDDRIIREKINQVEEFRFKMLLFRLLEIDPAARLASANDAIQVLNNSFQTEFKLPEKQELALDFSGYTLFRNQELENIIAVFTATRLSHNYFLIVAGENGSGKGRILDEFKLYNQLNNYKFYHISFTNGDQEPFYGLRQLIKILLNSYHERNMEDIKILTDLIFDQKISGYSTAEKEAIYRQIVILSGLSLEKRKTVIVVDNFEYADRESLLFLNFFLKNSYQKTHLFLAFFINQRLVRDNQEEHRAFYNLKESLVKINLPELEISQVKDIVNCFFNHITDIPDNLYSQMQQLAGTNISRLIKFLKYLYEEGLVVKTLKGYSFNHYTAFAEVVKNFISREIHFDEKRLDVKELAILQTLSIAQIALSSSELADITGFSQADIEKHLNNVFNSFYIKELIDRRSIYLISENAIKRIISTAMTPLERKKLHLAIGRSMETMPGEEGRYKRLTRLYHQMIGSFDQYAKFLDFKLLILKKMLFRDKLFDHYLALCLSLVAENPDMNLLLRLQLMSEVALCSIEKKCRVDYSDSVTVFLHDCREFTGLANEQQLYFAYLAVSLIYYTGSAEDIRPEELFSRLAHFLHEDNEYKVRTMNIFLLAYENVFSHKGYLPYLAELQELIKFDSLLTAEYYFTRIISIFYNKRNIASPDVDLTEDFIYEIRKYFAKIKSTSNSDLIDRAYLIISGFYRQCDYEEGILDFFAEAENYLRDRKMHEALFSLKTDLVVFLEKNNRCQQALQTINSALIQVGSQQDMPKLALLVKKRAYLKYVLEESASDVANDFSMLLDFLHKQKSETAEVYECLINLYLDAGNYKEVFETLHRYLKSMNREFNLSRRSREFYLHKLLQYYNVAQLRNISSSLLVDLNWSDDEFLDCVVDVKGQNTKSFSGLNSSATLSNSLILESVRLFYQTENKDNNDLLLQIVVSYDSETILYRRASLVLAVLNDAYNQESVEALKADINALYGKGYLNIARNLAAELAKVFFFNYRDEKNFLLFTEVAFKICGDLYYSTEAEFRSLIKDENFQLLNDLIKDIKSRYKK